MNNRNIQVKSHASGPHISKQDASSQSAKQETDQWMGWSAAFVVFIYDRHTPEQGGPERSPRCAIISGERCRERARVSAVSLDRQRSTCLSKMVLTRENTRIT
ncbi:hypothetical protein MTP99_003196 [Tenebrio molitor]|jgi:hypothetical protein|nr:hypothetical protein MTP99_003196 [Tenebrio molitor]